MAARSRKISEPVKPALLAALRAQLEQGEHLAWAACPEPPSERESGSRKLDAIVIVGGGYALIGACVMAFRSGQWLWLSLPVGLVALGLAIYSVVHAMKTRARKSIEGTVYGFTTRRALLVRTYPVLSVRALPIDSIASVSVRDVHDDVGDVCLQSSGSEPCVFERVLEAEGARTQIERVMRDPKATEEQIAAAETYALQMRQLMVRSVPQR